MFGKRISISSGVFHGGADDLARQIRRRLLPLGQHRRLDLVAPIHPAAFEPVGRMDLEHRDVLAGAIAQSRVEQALAGRVAAEVVQVDLALRHVVPVGEQLIDALDADDGGEGLVDPRIVGGVLGRLVGGDVQGVEAPLVLLPALDRVRRATPADVASPTRSRNVVCGSRVDITTLARSTRSSCTMCTPTARPFSMMILSTVAASRITPPCLTTWRARALPNLCEPP